MDKAFQFVGDLTRQVLTLSSALLALSVTFAKASLESAPFVRADWFLVFTWSALVVSILCGVLMLMMLTGQLASDSVEKPSVWVREMRFVSAAQLLSFVSAMILTFAFGLVALF